MQPINHHYASGVCVQYVCNFHFFTLVICNFHFHFSYLFAWCWLNVMDEWPDLQSNELLQHEIYWAILTSFTANFTITASHKFPVFPQRKQIQRRIQNFLPPKTETTLISYPCCRGQVLTKNALLKIRMKPYWNLAAPIYQTNTLSLSLLCWVLWRWASCTFGNLMKFRN